MTEARNKTQNQKQISAPVKERIQHEQQQKKLYIYVGIDIKPEYPEKRLLFAFNSIN